MYPLTISLTVLISRSENLLLKSFFVSLKNPYLYPLRLVSTVNARFYFSGGSFPASNVPRQSVLSLFPLFTYAKKVLCFYCLSHYIYHQALVVCLYSFTQCGSHQPQYFRTLSLNVSFRYRTLSLSLVMVPCEKSAYA